MPDLGHGFRTVLTPEGGSHLECPVLGEHLVTFPMFNKGTAFTEEERDELGLRGLLPPRVCSMEEQAARVLENYRQKPTDLERYIHLMALMDRNETLFYRVLLDHLEEMLPIVYTPTIGQACRHFGRIFRRARGIYLTPSDRGRVSQTLSHWPFRGVRAIVVTDGERILGLGDLGANGMGIPIGKLSLYVAAAGIHPSQTLPVCLDTGTDTEELRRDPDYLGRREPRIRGAPYDGLVEEFIEAARTVFPGVLIQFEDFGKDNAFRLLERYRHRICCFNDDVQGTGAAALAALLSAERLTGRPLAEERVVIAGSGSAGIGIARQIRAAMMEGGLSTGDAQSRFWLVDSKGLVSKSGRPGTGPKAEFAREEKGGSLAETVRAVKPTVLIGVTGMPGIFSERVLSTLGDRPLVLPLSNPTEKAECTPAEVRRFAGSGALTATGSPFPGVSQCNNVYIFPGVALGVLGAGAARVTDRMFLAAARQVSTLTTPEDLAKGALFPPLRDIRSISREVGRAVAKEAGYSGPLESWEPAYLPYRRAPDAHP